MTITEANKWPQGWQWVEIKDVVDIIVPTRDKPKRFIGDIPWVTLPDINDFFISSAKKFITHEDATEVSNRLMPPQTVLLSCAGSLGKVAVTTRTIYANQQFYGLVAKSNLIDPVFLAFGLQRLGEDFFFQLAGISTVGFFSKDKALGIRMILPPLAEQKRIVAIAQKADRLRRTRRYALQLSDTYLRSVFLEMFGDPVTNPMGWDATLIRDVTDIIVPTRDKPKRFTGNIPWITLPDLKGFFISNAKNLLTHEDAAEVSNRLMPANTVLLSCAGSLGKVVVTTREVYANQQFYGLVAKPKLINYLFLALSLKMLGEEFFFQLAGISTVGFFSKDKALDIKIILPPLPLQEKFAKIAQKFDRLRTQQQEADRQAEHLFQTLLHRAFGGELTSQNADDKPESVL
jgi:type I restriction enzyme S subunit